MIGIFLCAEDGVEVYPRQGKSIFPHQNTDCPSGRSVFFMPSPGRNGWIVTAFSSRRRLEKPHSGSPAAQTLWEKLPIPPLTLPVHTAAAPAPCATGRSPARRNSRRTPSVRHAHTAIDTPVPASAAEQSTPHIAASASPLFCRKIFMCLNNFCLRLYSLG